MSAREFERERARRQKEWEREQRDLARQRQIAHQQAQDAEAERRNQHLTEYLAALDDVFAAAVRRGNLLDFDAIKPPLPRFSPGRDAEPEPRPDPDVFRPAPPRWYERLLPGQQERLHARWEQARAAYTAAEGDWLAGSE